MKLRLDKALIARQLVISRSQAESWIKLGKVTVNGLVIKKTSFFVDSSDLLEVTANVQYVSRAGLKLESVARELKLDFRDKTILDVGSSTGGFTNYALVNGAKRVVAVDVGTEQLHSSLRQDKRVELHEKTDIRDFYLKNKPDIILIDVSFISLRDVLPHIADSLASQSSQIIAMVKPQFEAGKAQINKGVIKNDSIRRQILRDFEDWAKQYFVIKDKRDSQVAGAKGNQERFYLLQKTKI